VNHDLESFSDLAWRALENPADAALRAELAVALTEHPDWAGEWQALREAHALAREAVPAALAREQADRTAVIPAARLATLLASEASPRRRAVRPFWFAAAAALVLLTGGVVWQLRTPASPDLNAWARQSPPALAHALTAPFAEVLATAVLPTLRDSTTVQLRSPLLAATAGPVTIAWRHPTPLTLTLRENGRTLWTVTATTSPQLTPPLPADHVYELLLMPATGPAHRETFVTVPAHPAAPTATSLDAILTAATANPARLGEAVLAWHALPAETRASEPARRLALWLGVAARQPDLLAEARTPALPQ